MNAELKILLVDDFEAMRQIAHDQLTEIGFSNIETAADAESALPLLEAGDIGLLVTGRNLSGMSGLELVACVREDPRLTTLPVIMISSEARRSRIVEAVDAGVDSYIVKPFTVDVLREKVAAVLDEPALDS